MSPYIEEQRFQALTGMLKTSGPCHPAWDLFPEASRPAQCLLCQLLAVLGPSGFCLSAHKESLNTTMARFILAAL